MNVKQIVFVFILQFVGVLLSLLFLGISLYILNSFFPKPCSFLYGGCFLETFLALTIFLMVFSLIGLACYVNLMFKRFNFKRSSEVVGLSILSVLVIILLRIAFGSVFIPSLSNASILVLGVVFFALLLTFFTFLLQKKVRGSRKG